MVDIWNYPNITTWVSISVNPCAMVKWNSGVFHSVYEQDWVFDITNGFFRHKFAYFYFVHSFFVAPERTEDAVGITDYGIDYVSVAGNGRAFGVQFHPEKSQDAGLKLLKNFAEKV